MTTDRVVGAYMRGRLVIAGIRSRTAVTDVLDVLTVVAMECPGEALGKWRTGLDRAMATASARAARESTTAAPGDRASWGLLPHQIDAQRAFMARMGGG